eukprot:Sspe_Gene.62392::Locus_34995_Transcript_1_1_Confidence_1.000_Length_597::g.62392::m.62392
MTLPPLRQARGMMGAENTGQCAEVTLDVSEDLHPELAEYCVHSFETIEVNGSNWGDLGGTRKGRVEGKTKKKDRQNRDRGTATEDVNLVSASLEHFNFKGDDWHHTAAYYDGDDKEKRRSKSNSKTKISERARDPFHATLPLPGDDG